MVFVANLISLPFLILTWLIESYLFLTAMRLIMAVSQTARQSQFYYQLKLITDSLPNVVSRVITKGRNVSPPGWLSWLIVIALACIVRQVLVSIVLM